MNGSNQRSPWNCHASRIVSQIRDVTSIIPRHVFLSTIPDVSEVRACQVVYLFAHVRQRNQSVKTRYSYCLQLLSSNIVAPTSPSAPPRTVRKNRITCSTNEAAGRQYISNSYVNLLLTAVSSVQVQDIKRSGLCIDTRPPRDPLVRMGTHCTRHLQD